MKSRRGEREPAIEEQPIRRPWDNSGLRHRVEGRAIDGVDIRSLQTSVVARAGESSRRRRSSRVAPAGATSPEVELAQDLDRQAP
jgi:hypothetical protein